MTIADILAAVWKTLGTFALPSTDGQTVSFHPADGQPITDNGWTWQPPTVTLTPWREGVMWTEHKTVTDPRGRDRSENSGTFAHNRQHLETLLGIYAHDMCAHGWVTQHPGRIDPSWGNPDYRPWDGYCGHQWHPTHQSMRMCGYIAWQNAAAHRTTT